MIGQLKLINQINNYTYSSLPHSILLLGKKGSGKHTLASYIANKFNLSLIDITEKVLEEDLNNYYISATQLLLLIDLNSITEKEQNKLLKLVEEPPLNCYIALLCNSKDLVLQTLTHRCTELLLENYSKEELQQFTDKEIDTDIFQTPGQIINFNFNTLKDTLELVDKIINKIDKANFANTLTITNKFNFKDEYDKIDLDIFVNALLNKLILRYKEDNNTLYKNYYIITSEFAKKLNNSRLNKQVLVDNYLVKMWKESRNGY